MLIILLLIAVIFMVTGLSGAPWVPARSFDVERLLDDVNLQKGQVFYELGCGDGRLVVAAAARGAVAVGYELNPLLWVIAWVRCLRYPTAKVKLANLWTVDLSKADVVMAFLVPRTMPRLHRKAKAELKSTALLVSYIFPIVGKKALPSRGSWHIYRYTHNSSKKAVAQTQ